MKAAARYYLTAVINSYAILFFSQNKVLGGILLLVSFFNSRAGLAGLLCTLFAIAYTTLTGHQRTEIQKGIYSFNAMLFGIGMGTFYHYNAHFFAWLIVGCLLCIFVTIGMGTWLGKSGLPFLSLPFIVTFWILFSAANSVFHLGLAQHTSILLSELAPERNAQELISLAFLGYYPQLFFRSVSALLFQDNALSGLLITIGLLVHSRIALSVWILGFIAALAFNALLGTYPEGISYYHLGTNLMLPAMAIGSFFLIPSWRSYLWAVVVIPLSFLLINGLTRILGVFDLPVISLPFCIVSILLLYVFIRQNKKQPLLTPVQYYSPEKNLYQHLNAAGRLNDLKYFDIKLPFMGRWKVSQGYDGHITHKNDWGKALDFVIADDDGKTYKKPGSLPEHFYCFNKPVLACGNGIVEELIDHVDDNHIGEINTKENWGNSIVIKHSDGLYSKVSHLKKGSAKVKPGDFVKQGDVIALCGNSGRSPEPHLHFQLQATPYIGSKSLEYPFSSYIKYNGEESFKNYAIPHEGELIAPVTINASLRKSFNFQPGYTATISDSQGKLENWEVQADEFNQVYFHCKSTDSYAYFINNGTTFYFTDFYGDQHSLLYYFYLAAYHVNFTVNSKVTDVYPLQLAARPLSRWLQDVIAPFYQYLKLNYHSENVVSAQQVIIHSKQVKTGAGVQKELMNAGISVIENGIKNFTINMNGLNLQASWQSGT